MIKPKTLKDWDFVKNKKHDIMCLTENRLSPKDYYYQCDNGVYSPVIRVRDWEEYTIKHKNK